VLFAFEKYKMEEDIIINKEDVDTIKKVDIHTDEKRISTVPRYVINLDESPEDRWNQLIEDYADQWIEVHKIIKNEIKNMLGNILGAAIDNIIQGIMSAANTVGAVYYARELKAISKKSGIKLGRLVMLQLVYEISACCTSIVVEDAEGTPHHIRTMDWQMEFLEPLTVELDIQKNGKTIFLATSWAGYVGILTGIKPDAFSVSVNFRVTDGGSMWSNIKNALTSCWPVGFLVREIFESASSFNEAVGHLSNSNLIAPCYITICGLNSGEGVLLTRDRKQETNRWTLSEHGFIVQTNIDHWSEDPNMDVMDSIERRTIARRAIDSLIENGEINKKKSMVCGI